MFRLMTYLDGKFEMNSDSAECQMDVGPGSLRWWIQELQGLSGLYINNATHKV